jgi:glycosyltransferase involved in cell wall biosynthesis
MRLTLVIASLTRGGAERVMSILAGAWVRQGHQVTLLTFDHGEEPAYPLDPAVNRQSLGLLAHSNNFLQGIWRNFGRILTLRHAIRDSRPDIVLSFLDTTNVLTLLATRGLSVPMIISERTDPALYDIGTMWDLLRRFVYPLADVLVCPTEASLKKFQAIVEVSGFAIPNPVAITPAPPVAPALQKEPSAGRVLIAMGRLVPQKGFDLLLEAFAKIAGRHREWTLTVLGEGPQRHELQAQTESLHLGSRVHFAGAVADPFSRLRAADLFVFSSRFEGFGMALAEAMACGLPVVSFECPEGPGEIIRDGIDGVLVPPEDVDALANALDRLMGDADERQRLASRAPEVGDRFSVERAVSRWQDLFDGVLAERWREPSGLWSRLSKSKKRVVAGGLLLTIAATLAFFGWFAYSSHSKKIAQARREAAYQASLAQFQSDLPSGTSRAEVEKYLHSRGMEYQRWFTLRVVTPNPNNPRAPVTASHEYGDAESDLVDIGRDPGDLACNYWVVDIILEFDRSGEPAATHPGREADSSDKLKDVQIKKICGYS